jgi:molecular chaperone DnaK
LVAEPTAAALAYDLRDEDSLTALVFDLGGGTFDASIIDIGDSIYDVKATRGDNALGGDDWTECIVEFLADSIARDHDVQVPSEKRDPLLHGRLWLAAEKMKLDLGASKSTRPDSLQYLNVDDVVIPVVESVLTREEFEWRTENLRQRLVEHLDSLFEGCGYRHQDIDEVLLVGGSTRLTQVQELVANYFDKPPRRAKNPDEIVASGAAIQAAILAATPALPESSDEFLPEVVKTGDAELSLYRATLLDSATRSLGFSAHIDGSEELEYVEVIRNNTSIPVEEWKDGFQPFKPDSGKVGASSVSFDIYETNETDPTPDFREKRHMGKIRIRNLNPSIPIEEQQLEISFKIDADNLLHVQAIEETTGNEAQGTFEPNLGISAGELEEESKALPRVYEQ